MTKKKYPETSQRPLIYAGILIIIWTLLYALFSDNFDELLIEKNVSPELITPYYWLFLAIPIILVWTIASVWVRRNEIRNAQKLRWLVFILILLSGALISLLLIGGAFFAIIYLKAIFR